MMGLFRAAVRHHLATSDVQSHLSLCILYCTLFFSFFAHPLILILFVCLHLQRFNLMEVIVSAYFNIMTYQIIKTTMNANSFTLYLVCFCANINIQRVLFYPFVNISAILYLLSPEAHLRHSPPGGRPSLLTQYTPKKLITHYLLLLLIVSTYNV